MTRTKLAILAVVLGVFAAHAWAEEKEEDKNKEQAESPWPRASIAVGGFVSTLQSNMRIGTQGTSLDMNLNDALGMESSDTVFRVDADYRFGSTRRHKVAFSYFDLSRSGTRTLDEAIEVGGVTYPIGTTVSSEFDLVFYNARYSYSFLLDDRVDFAVSAGLHVTRVGLSVNATGIGQAGDSVTAPLPVLGLSLDVALTHRWYMRSSIEALYLKYGDFTGVLADSILALEYRPWKHFSFGAGFNSVNMGLRAEDSSGALAFQGDVDVRFVGLLLYGRVMF